MNKNLLTLVTFLLLCLTTSKVFAESDVRDTTVIPPFATTNYNDSFYTSVLSAATGIGQPFLLQQGYLTMPGVTVIDTSLVYNGIKYPVSQAYNTSRTTNNDGFYISPSQYAYYGITNFKSVWKVESPNIFFDGTNNTFKTRVDCIGYGARVIASVGGQTSSTNAFLLLSNGILNAGICKFAAIGRVPDSYEMATSFATLGTTSIAGWEYISGNVLSTDIQTYNLTLNSALNNYTGIRKGGFSKSQPGDIFCFGDGPKSSASGHTMIMAHNPILLNATSLRYYFPKVTTTSINTLLSKNNVYQVDIFDDCNYRHFNDSRTLNGVGYGSVLIVADTADDAPIGYFFSPSSNLTYTPLSTSKTYAICVARYTNPSPLPVSYESFSAEVISTLIQLKWRTTQEKHTIWFTLQHSTDSKSFEDMGTIMAIGNNQNNYLFTDNHPASGLNYYRLMGTDNNGNKSYSSVININFSLSNDQLSVFPNPAINSIAIKGSHISNIWLLDDNGRIAIEKIFQDATNPSLNLNNLPRGKYYLSIRTKDKKTNTIAVIKE